MLNVDRESILPSGLYDFAMPSALHRCQTNTEQMLPARTAFPCASQWDDNLALWNAARVFLVRTFCLSGLCLPASGMRPSDRMLVTHPDDPLFARWPGTDCLVASLLTHRADRIGSLGGYSQIGRTLFPTSIRHFFPSDHMRDVLSSRLTYQRYSYSWPGMRGARKWIDRRRSM